MFTSQLLMIGTSELLLVAGIALLLFGSMGVESRKWHKTHI